MSSQEPERKPVENERGLITNKYVIIVSMALFVVVIINSWYLSSSTLSTQLDALQGADFTLMTLSGENFTLSSSRGKAVIINFMHTSCQYCRAEIPQLKRVWDAYGGEVVIISISTEPLSDTDEVLRNFASSYGANWIWARDVVGATISYQVPVFFVTPTTYILDQEGLIRYRHVGYTEAPTFMNELDVLINSYGSGVNSTQLKLGFSPRNDPCWLGSGP